MMHLLKPTLVIQCTHCPQAAVQWLDNGVGKPPDLIFKGFPEAGRVILSKNTILLSCDRCKSQLEVIQEEYGKTLQL